VGRPSYVLFPLLPVRLADVTVKTKLGLSCMQAILGGAIGGSAFLCCTCGCCWYWRRRRARGCESEDEESERHSKKKKSSKRKSRGKEEKKGKRRRSSDRDYEASKRCCESSDRPISFFTLIWSHLKLRIAAFQDRAFLRDSCEACNDSGLRGWILISHADLTNPGELSLHRCQKNG
jgi:hypothetical protein